eukprot:351537-Chlamydomonas_euryale.AAC.7
MRSACQLTSSKCFAYQVTSLKRVACRLSAPTYFACQSPALVSDESYVRCLPAAAAHTYLPAAAAHACVRHALPLPGNVACDA